MSFPLYYANKIALAKSSKNNLSRVIIFIGRLSVALGVIVSLITVSTGLGSKYAIRDRLADFTGELMLKSTRSNTSYNSSALSTEALNLPEIKRLQGVEGMQKFVTASGILRTKDNFAGIIFKGVGKDFDHARFKKFLVAGETPQVTEDGFNGNIVLSQKIAVDLGKKVGDSVVAIFSKEDQKPLYRKFRISGIYSTDIKMIDDLYIIGGINHARKITGLGNDDAGGYDIFLDNRSGTDRLAAEIQQLAGYKNYVEKVTDNYPQIVDWISIFDVNIALIIGIMLAVVIINIIMVLLILIIERTNSIGILKTLGANNRCIRQIFIYYTLIIMLPGLLFGNLIGIGLLLLQKYFGIIKLNPENYYVSEVPVDLNPILILSISLGMLIISALTLILPSYLISKISPVRSIRYS